MGTQYGGTQYGRAVNEAMRRIFADPASGYQGLPP
jgi:hypothetical protein